MHEGPNTHTQSTGSSEAMRVLCIAALLLSAAAAQPDSWRPRRDERFPTAGGPKPDSVGHEMPPWFPKGRPQNGNPRRPMKGTARNEPGRPSRVSARGNRQVPGFTSDESGVPLPGLGRQVPRHKRGKRPNRKNPGARVFSPVFKVDNMTLQNVTDITLKEGENVFLMLKHGGRGAHHHRGGRRESPKNGQYVKLFYNATQPNKVSVEFGVVKPINLGIFFAEEDNPEEDY